MDNEKLTKRINQLTGELLRQWAIIAQARDEIISLENRISEVKQIQAEQEKPKEPDK